MLNIISKASPLASRLTLNPIQTLVKLDQKRRQRQALQKLDANALADIGMTAARRNVEVCSLRNW